MNLILAGLITLLVGLLTFILITLNENKKEIWNEIYKRMGWKDE